MKYFYYCLVFFSTVSVAVLLEVKKIYVVEHDLKTGSLRTRRENAPVEPHTFARIGKPNHHHHHHHHHHQQQRRQQKPHDELKSHVTPHIVPLLNNQQQQPVDLTADNRVPIDYLTPPANTEFHFQNFQPASDAVESLTRSESNNLLQQTPEVIQVQSPPMPPPMPPVPPPPLVPLSYPTTSLGNNGVEFVSAQTQPPPTSLSVQTSLPSNQVHSLTAANPPAEQFVPFTPTNYQHQQQNHGGRWELGFDANEILTPPSAGGTEQSSGGPSFGRQDFGQEAAGLVRNNKQFPNGGTFFGGSGFDTVAAANNNRFTPLDAVIRTSSSVNNNNNNNNVHWGTAKTAQQPVRPSSLNTESNAFRYNNNNNHRQHQQQHVNTHQIPFTGQFDGPLSQGTVADHVVHSSYRIKRQLRDMGLSAAGRDADENANGGRFDDRKPVYSFVKTDRNGNFKWSVRHGY